MMPLSLHRRDHLPAEGGKAALLDPVHRAGEFIVEEMRQADHAEAGVVEHVEVLGLALQVLRAFDRKQGADLAVAAGAAEKQRPQVGGRADDHQPAFGGGLGALQLFGVPERAFEQRGPGGDRLQLADGERGDVVGIAAVAFVILALGGLGHAGEHLQRDIALLQPGKIDMAVIDAVGEVALPQQGVAVQIDDGQPLVQRRSAAPTPARASPGPAPCSSIAR